MKKTALKVLSEQQAQEYPQWKLEVEAVLCKLASEEYFTNWQRSYGFMDGGWSIYRSVGDLGGKFVDKLIARLSRDIPWALHTASKEDLPLILASGELGHLRVVQGIELVYAKRYCEMVLSGELKREDR